MAEENFTPATFFNTLENNNSYNPEKYLFDRIDDLTNKMSDRVKRIRAMCQAFDQRCNTVANDNDLNNSNTGKNELESTISDMYYAALNDVSKSKSKLASSLSKLDDDLAVAAQNISYSLLNDPVIEQDEVFASNFKTLFQHAAIGVCLIKNDGRIEQVNAHLEKLFRYSYAELKDQPVETIMPGIKPLVKAFEYLQNIDSPEVQSLKQVLKTWALKNNGYQFPVEVSFGKWGKSENSFTLIFINDITEKALSDSKFKVIFYRSPVAKILTDLETGKLVDVNENFCRLMKYAKTELIGKTTIELGIINAQKRKKNVDSIRKTGKLAINEIELSTKYGERIYAHISAEQIEILNKTFLLSTFLDITEQRKATAALEEAKRKLEEEAEELKRLNDAGNRLWAVNNLQDGLKEVLNASIELTRADKGTIQLYDKKKEALILRTHNNFFEDFINRFQQVTANDTCTCGIALKNRAQSVTEDTEKEWNENDASIARHNEFRSCQSTPLLFRDGTPMGMISTCFKDPGSPSALTLKRMELYALVAENFLERIQNYEIIQQHNTELEKKVADRTKELIISLEHEKYLNDMKSRFVSIASHEFRTPLTTILSSIMLIKSYYSDEHKERRAKHITRVEKSVATLVDILNDFLSLEKLEQGKMEIILSNFDLKTFAEDVLEELNGLLKPGQRIQLSYNGEEEIIQDKKILKNVLRNLLSNAIKYSPAGQNIECLIDVNTENVIVRVKDHGIGIAKEEQDNLFSNFFRAKNATQIQGTGLGLSIVKKYVELLHGSITFFSKLNEGTTFTVTFPTNNVQKNPA